MMPTHPVNDLVAYVHVGDVQRSIDFYAYLGFEATDVTLYEGATVWALLVSGNGRLMVAQADEEIDRQEQGILFYLYAPDLVALREELDSEGVPVGVIEHPEYMPNGVMRLEDPDGYVLMIAQR